MNLAEHTVECVLREIAGERIVLQARLPSGQRCTTRLLLAPVDAHLDRLVRAMILSGRGSPVGLPAEVVEIIEAYRVRLRLGGIQGLPTVLDAGVSEDPPAAVTARPPAGKGWVYVTTTWVEGRPLDAAWATADEPTRRRLALGVAGRLAAMHGERVCFGDLKPSNVIVDGDRVNLIDLDTLREVPERDLGVRTTAATQEYAAPEQMSRRETFLASDIWAFGETLARLVTGEPASPVRITAAGPQWGPIIARCQAMTPGARPTAIELVDHLEHGRRLPDHEVTVRVPDPPPHPQPDGPTEPDGATVGADVTRPVPSRTQISEVGPSASMASSAPSVPAWMRSGTQDSEENPSALIYPSSPSAPTPTPPPRRGLRISAFAASTIAGLTGLAGVGALMVQLSAQHVACQEVEAQRAALKAHKTVREKNDQESLAAIIQQLEQVVSTCNTPEAHGVHALARVWRAGWQMRTAKFDAATFDAVRPFVEGVRGSDVPEAIAARVGFDGAQCRLLLPDEAGRLAACERVHRAADAALQALPTSEWGWLRVEISWADAMAGLGEVQRLANTHSPEAQSAATATLDSCLSGLSDVPEAPVNGIEMLETCMRVAGHARDLTTHAAFAALAAPIAVAAEGKTRLRRLSEIYTSVAPECDRTKAGSDGLPTPRPGDGGWPDWCAVAAARSIGCGDRVLPPERVVSCSCTDYFDGSTHREAVTRSGRCPTRPFSSCTPEPSVALAKSGVPWYTLIANSGSCPL